MCIQPKIDAMEKAGSIGETIFRHLVMLIEPGATTEKLCKAAASTIEFNGAIPEFLGYGPGPNPFPAEICVSLNEEVCHGIPGDRVIGGGDLVSIDMGIRVDGYVVDACRTFQVGEVSEEADHLNYWTKTALKRAIRHVKAGKNWNDIAKIIENTAKNKNLGIVRAMSGHGIGEKLHESPTLPNYVSEMPGRADIILEEGQTICIEPMFSLEGDGCEIAEDGWTVLTKSRSLSSHWEHCIMVTKTGCEIFL